MAVGLLSQAVAAMPPAQYEIIPVSPSQPAIVYATPLSNEIMPRLIQCESGGRNIKHLDVNNFYSYGILQIQSSTAARWNKESGLNADPMIPDEAIKLGHWAISNGYLKSWLNCAKKLGYVPR